MSATKSAYVPTVDSATVEAYRAADKSEKAKIRTRLSATVDSAIEALDLHTAADARATLAACVTAPKSESESVPVTLVVARRIATLRAAADAIESGHLVPEGLDADEIDYESLPDEVQKFWFLPSGAALGQWTDEVRESASKMATAKITRSGDRHDIGEVIVRAFESQPVGTVLTVAQIRAAGSVEGYVPSPGAVANKIQSGHEMIALVPADANGPLRARRV